MLSKNAGYTSTTILLYVFILFYFFFVSAELVELDVFLFGLSRNDSIKDKEGFNARNSRYFAVEWG